MQRFFYCNDSKNVFGPFTLSEIVDLYNVGVITKATQLCQEGTELWDVFSSISLAPQEASVTPLVISESLVDARNPSDPTKITVLGVDVTQWPQALATVIVALILATVLIYFMDQGTQVSGYKFHNSSWLEAKGSKCLKSLSVSSSCIVIFSNG